MNRQHVSSASRPYLRLSRNLYAGLCSERMFDPDFRQGSSLDEAVMSQLCGMLAAGDADPQTFWNREVHEYVAQSLRRHRAAVIAMADYLMCHHELSGAPLAEFCGGFE